MIEYSDTRHTTPTDSDVFEQSPSTGARQTAEAMHAVFGFGDPDPIATCNPVDAYLKDFFGVSS